MNQQEAFIPSHSIGQRIIAVSDVLLVFVVTFTLIRLAALLPIGKIEWKFLAYTIMMAFLLLIQHY